MTPSVSRGLGPQSVGHVGCQNPRIKSLSGASSPGFIGVRAAGQAGGAYLDERSRTAVNCNPDCNPGLDGFPLAGSRRSVHPQASATRGSRAQTMRYPASLAGPAAAYDASQPAHRPRPHQARPTSSTNSQCAVIVRVPRRPSPRHAAAAFQDHGKMTAISLNELLGIQCPATVISEVCRHELHVGTLSLAATILWEPVTSLECRADCL
jgi:hypothetical protein